MQPGHKVTALQVDAFHSSQSSYLFRNVVEMNITEAHRDLGHYSSPGSQNMNISLLCDGDDDCFHSSASPDKNYWALLLLVLCVSVVFGNVLVTLYSFIVKLRQGSGKDWQGMAVKAKGLKA